MSILQAFVMSSIASRLELFLDVFLYRCEVGSGSLRIRYILSYFLLAVLAQHCLLGSYTSW